MKLREMIQKFSLLFTMLVIILTAFCVLGKQESIIQVVYAEESISSSDVDFTPEDNRWNVETVEEAIDYLYGSKFLLQLDVENGTLNKEFSPGETDYEILVDKYSNYFTLSGTLYDDYSLVTGFGDYDIEENETRQVTITVTSRDGEIKLYNITATRDSYDDSEHTTKLKNLTISGTEYNINPRFHSSKIEYTIEIATNEIDLNVSAIPFDSEATVVVEGNKYIKQDTGTVTVTVSEPHSETTVYTLNYVKSTNIEKKGKSKDVGYTNGESTYTVPYRGMYKLEVWGAQGGGYNDTYHGGYGGYATGVALLDRNDILYINVGGQGELAGAAKLDGGYNGGGSILSTWSDGNERRTTGGGATHIATKSGLLSSLATSKSSILIVAGGGGAAQVNSAILSSANAIGGSGGGFIGGTGIGSNVSATGGTQEAGGTAGTNGTNGAFGEGSSCETNGNCSAGGGGYYGGGGSLRSAGGGSGFIASEKLISHLENIKLMQTYCESNCAQYVSHAEDTRTYTTTNVSDHAISEYTKKGNGFAKITPLTTPPRDNYLASLESDEGTLSPAFDPTVENYTLNIDKYTDNVTFTGELSDSTATVTGLDNYELDAGETKNVEIVVTSYYGDIRTYKVAVKRGTIGENEHTSELSKLVVSDYKLDKKFNHAVYDYSVSIFDDDIYLDVLAVPFDSEATVKIEGDKYLKEDNGQIKITVSEPHSEDSIYTINYSKDNSGNFKISKGFTGSEEEIDITATGLYKIELWGAQGGGYNDTYHGGYGGYAVGYANLNNGDKLYLNVGGQGVLTGTKYHAGGYNGGGAVNGTWSDSNEQRATGGGATHIATATGLLSSLSSDKDSVIMVAGGGGSAQVNNNSLNSLHSIGGSGGGYIGGSANGVRTNATGGTQTDAGLAGTNGTDGSFGQGSSCETNSNCSGAGGGYYGGGGGYSGAGGGSGFIASNILFDKAMYMFCDENCGTYVSDAIPTKTYVTTDISETPTSNFAKKGDGYAKIELLRTSKNNYLKSLNSDKGTFDEEFDPSVEEHTLIVGMDDEEVTLSGELFDSKATVTGLGTYEYTSNQPMPVEVVVTSESGDIKTYTINVEREVMTNMATLSTLRVSSYDLNPEFDPSIRSYEIDILADETDLNIEAISNDENAIVEVTGNRALSGKTGTVVIKVSAPGKNTNTYKIKYDRSVAFGEAEFDCINNYEIYEVPFTGLYKLEVWGAQGAGSQLPGNTEAGISGKGGYSKGTVALRKSDKVYVYVGCTGEFTGSGIAHGGFNGGGAAFTTQTDDPANGGGGATDIRINSHSLYSRLIVAGGGGGGSEDVGRGENAGAGGGINGLGNASGQNYGGTQTSASGGAAFGYGANTPNDGGGGGGGWYGGGTNNGSQTLPTSNTNADTNGGSGGSGFVLTADTVVNTPEGYLLGDRFYMTDAETIAGNKNVPTYDGTSTMVGNEGNGHAKITPLEVYSTNNYLSSLTPSVGELSPAFSSANQNYTLTTSVYDQKISFDAVAENTLATVMGTNEDYALELGDNYVNIYVTAQSGEIRTYTIKVVRPHLTGNEHSTKIQKITYFDDLTIYPNENELEHTLVPIPMPKSRINISAVLYDLEATYEIKGAELLSNDGGIIEIIVSEPHTEPTTYTLHYTKYEVEQKIDYTCVNGTQYYTVPTTGRYKLEVWGSQGGGYNAYGNIYDDAGYGGAGGYSYGTVNLKYNEKLFIEVGCYGLSNVNGIALGGYNGGGAAFTDQSGDPASGGGGATDIRINTNSLYSRVIVAGGGGGGSEDRGKGELAGAGGGESGLGNSNGNNYGGKQTSASGGGAFGYGANTSYDGGGGGGGWYGGGTPGGSQKIPTSNTNEDTNGGSGGSGFVLTAATAANTPEGYLLDSTYYMTNAETIAGNQQIPTPESEKVRTTGNLAEGHARITPLDLKSDDNYLKSLESDIGTLSPAFDPLVTNYTLSVDMYKSKITLSGEANSTSAYVFGMGEYVLELGENKAEISVIAEDGTIRLYTITITRDSLSNGEHTAELEKLLIDQYPDLHFEKNVYDYTIEILPGEAELFITAVPYDAEATYEISGNEMLSEEDGEIKIVVHEPHSDDITYTIHYEMVENVLGQEFDCTEHYQTFDVKINGLYLLEVWGAQGAGSNMTQGWDLSEGGKGGYSKGKLYLRRGQTLYVYVGCTGKTSNSGLAAGGWNGGGAAFASGASENAAGGGGATDIRTIKDDIYSRFIVAGGGGGGGEDWQAAHYDYPGVGGGLEGTGSYTLPANDERISPYPGKQTESSGGGVFGYGANTPNDGGGGGGGWYGGGARNGSQNIPTSNDTDDTSGGAGGSGFVLTYETLKNTPPGYLVGSNYFLKDAETIAGNQEMPTHDGTDTMIGNSGHGYAKISLADNLSKNNYLNSIRVTSTISGQVFELEPEFNSLVQEYHITADVNDTEVKIEARPASDLATITGIGKHDVEAGENKYEILVTAEDGSIRTYTVTIERPASTVSTAKNIIITGLIDSVCNAYEGYCELDSEFSEENSYYYMTVPSGIRELEFTVEKNHKNQSVVGGGIIKLEPGDNVVTIEVTSEDGNHRTVYSYEITRDMTGDNYIDNIEFVNPKVDIGFHYLNQEYSFKVENDITSLDMIITLDDPNATYHTIISESNLYF